MPDETPPNKSIRGLLEEPQKEEIKPSEPEPSVIAFERIRPAFENGEITPQEMYKYAIASTQMPLVEPIVTNPFTEEPLTGRQVCVYHGNRVEEMMQKPVNIEPGENGEFADSRMNQIAVELCASLYSQRAEALAKERAKHASGEIPESAEWVSNMSTIAGFLATWMLRIQEQDPQMGDRYLTVMAHLHRTFKLYSLGRNILDSLEAYQTPSR